MRNEPASPTHGSYTGHQWTVHMEAKQAIAKHIVDQQLIEPYSGVLLDAGSTVGWVAREIFRREGDPALSLTLVTNNMGIWRDFYQTRAPGNYAPPTNHTLVLMLTGGEYDRNHDALFGGQAVRGIEAFHPRAVVLGASGLTFDKGGGAYYRGDGAVKRAMWEKQTEHRIIVCDHSKIGREDTFLVGDIETVAAGARMCTIVTAAPDFAGEAPAEGSPRQNQEKQQGTWEESFQAQQPVFEELFRRLGKPALTLVRVHSDGSYERFGF